MGYFDWIDEGGGGQEITPAVAPSPSTGKKKRRSPDELGITEPSKLAYLQRAYPQGLSEGDIAAEGLGAPAGVQKANIKPQAPEMGPLEVAKDMADTLGVTQAAKTVGGIQKAGIDIAGQVPGMIKKAVGIPNAPGPNDPPPVPEGAKWSTEQVPVQKNLQSLWTDRTFDHASLKDAFSDAMTAMLKEQPKFDPRAPVSNFGVGLGAVAQALGPQAIDAVLRPMVMDAQDELDQQADRAREERETIQKGKPVEGPIVPGGEEVRMGGGTEDKHARLKELRGAFAETGLNNFGSILAFVLTSMVIGPQMASLFFIDHAKRGTLKGEIDSLMDEIDDDKRQVAKLDDREYNLRSRAAEGRQDRRFRMEEHDVAEFNRATRESQKLAFAAEKYAADTEMKKVVATGKKLNDQVRQDLATASSMERDATEIERNDMAGKSKAAVIQKREEARQLRNRAEATRQDYDEWMTRHGLDAEAVDEEAASAGGP